MKKLFTLLLALMLGLSVKAQCPLQTAVDFTATDVHGETIHLFDILDSGQYVVIDFFFTTCVPCQQATPKIRDSYTLMGCNQHDVFYMEISDRDSDAACLNWVNNYGIEYPTISRPEGGNTICNQYQIGAFPTVILIRPDHSIAIGDLWPINSAQTIVDALVSQGVQPHDCNEPGGELTITPDTLWFSQMDDEQTFTIMNGTDESVTINQVQIEEESYLVVLSPSFPYPLRAGQSVDVVVGLRIPPIPPTKDDYLSYDIQVSTSLGEKQVLALVQSTLYDKGLLPCSYGVTLDEEQPMLDLYVYNDNAGTQTPIIIDAIEEVESEGGPYLYIEPSATLPQTVNAGERFYFNIMPLQTGDKGVANTCIEIRHDAGTTSIFVEIDGELLFINECQDKLTLYPNPANDFATLKGEDLGLVQVFNILGQKVDESEANGTELNINTSSYENGIYVVKAGVKILRFLVRH